VEVEEALLAQGHKLFELLVQPVERFLLPMRRLLIIPDGPLHALPFGALVRSPEPREYLAEWKPLHVAASGSVHAELAARARSAAARTYREQLVVVAAPDADRALGGQDGLAGDLPGARLEAEALTQIIPSARVYTGSAASEERVRSLGEGIRYIHIATHGFVDGRSPFDGGLFLAPSADVPEKDGLLKAWDILAEIRVDSELVVLSACDTGGGAILGPEGVVGLTRAWQHAGVPSVVASLWPVSDSSTATLMRCFYQALQAGLKRDEALQSAQRALIDRSGREPRAARLRHPFHWASFQLYGQP
jgi:CHAT domain-containing protein